MLCKKAWNNLIGSLIQECPFSDWLLTTVSTQCSQKTRLHPIQLEVGEVS